MKATEPPAAVAAAIDRLLTDSGLNDAERGLLSRLKSSDPVLTGEVWPRFARVAPGWENWFVELVLGAYREAHSFRKRMPNRHGTAELWGWIKETVANDIPTPLGLAGVLESLASDMMRTGLELRGPFNDRLGDGHPDYDATAALIRQAGQIFERINADFAEQNQRRSQELKPWPSLPRKLGAENAREVHFSRVLSCCLDRIFGTPCDAIVSAVTAVVFGDGKGTELPSRSRRRVAHSARKSP
jgi:hypothetical protein